MPGEDVRMTVVVNGVPHRLTGDSDAPLVDVLRSQVGLDTTRRGCATESCGDCTVLLNDRATRACATPAGQADGGRITTAEGLAAPGRMPPAQLAFLDESSFACPSCAPLRAMSAVMLMASGEADSPERIAAWREDHRCRCGEP